jgi:cytochrome b
MSEKSSNGHHASGPREVRVWDLVVRIGHWTLVVAFATAWLTGEEESLVHIWSGYAIAAVVALRLLWGVVGTRYARFRDFVRGPGAVVAYLLGLAKGSAPRYIGHNPAGGAMAIALLVALAVTTISGMMVYAIEENAGPLAGFAKVGDGAPALPAIVPMANARDDDDHRTESRGERDEEFWEELHEASANVTLALIVLHVLGVLASSLVHRENLVRSMVTGNKRPD